MNTTTSPSGATAHPMNTDLRTGPDDNSTTHPVILIDASGWLFRAYHALPPLTSPQGEPTGAVYGMANMLRKLLRDFAPQSIAVVLDAPGKTFRDELYPAYKANRDETPEDLKAQFVSVLELIETMGLPLLQVTGVEADDVIGTLAARAAAAGREVLIVTSDKDMAQLVTDRVHLLDTMKNRRMDPAGVVEKFGVPAERIIDYLALMGDSVDNIPGVPGVGEKTAAKLIKEHGSMDGVIAAADGIKGKLGENIRGAIALLPLYRTLTTIHCDVELPITYDALQPTPPDLNALAALYQKFGFNRLRQETLAELGGEPAASVGSTPSTGAESSPTTSAESPANSAAPTVSVKTRATTVMDAAQLADLINELSAAPLICVDTETDSLDSMQANLVGLSFAIRAGEGWYVPVAHNYLGAPAQLNITAVLDAVRPLLEDPKKPKVGQHIKYDLNVLHRHGVQVQGVAFDTMLESYVLDAVANRHDMDTLAEKHLGHQTIHYEDITGKGKSQIPFSQVDIDKAADYSAEDADITLRLHEVLYPQVAASASLKEVFETIEMPLVPVLAQIEQNGVKLDTELLARISSELARRMEELKTQVYQEAGGEFNLGSPKQLQTILYERLQLPVLGKTPKGEPSTAEEVLEQLAAQHPLPRLILEWRGLSKLRSTYTESLPNQVNQHTKRVHTSYHQAVAATGRLSSTDPNLQNIPVRTAEGRRIREAFIAEPGNQLLSIDYSQIELRLMAHFSGDAGLQKAFHEGLDIHRATAAEVFGLPVNEVSSEQRRAAKAINFGLIYGISAFGLARNLGIGRGEAQSYMDLFFTRYPGVRSFMDESKAKARELGFVETLFGRRLHLKDIHSKNAGLRGYAERIAINAPLQGTAADLIKLAMIDIANYLSEHAPALRMIMQVHDELVFEGPTDLLAEHAAPIANRMCRIRSLSVPLVADYGLGNNWDVAHESTGHARS